MTDILLTPKNILFWFSIGTEKMSRLNLHSKGFSEDIFNGHFWTLNLNAIRWAKSRRQSRCSPVVSIFYWIDCTCYVCKWQQFISRRLKRSASAVAPLWRSATYSLYTHTSYSMCFAFCKIYVTSFSACILQQKPLFIIKQPVSIMYINILLNDAIFYFDCLCSELHSNTQQYNREILDWWKLITLVIIISHWSSWTCTYLLVYKCVTAKERSSIAHAMKRALRLFTLRHAYVSISFQELFLLIFPHYCSAYL